MKLNRANCQKKYCTDRIYSHADWRKQSVALKNQLRDDGVIDFEFHPEYTAHVGCKTNINRYYTPDECERMKYGIYNPSPSPTDVQIPTPPVRAYPPPQRDKKSRCKKGTTRNKRTGNCEPTKNKSRYYPFRPSSPLRPSSPPKQSNNKSRCKRGTRRNKRTGNCEPTNKSRYYPPRQPSPKPVNIKSRCKKGTRRNKRTGNCEPTK